MNRFFVNRVNISDENKEIIINNPEDIKHISRVLRLKEGNIVEICDNEGYDYYSKINFIKKDIIICSIIERIESKGEPPIDLVLFQALPKSNKMDLIVQKSVELGIKKIVPIITNRCVVKIKDKKSENNKVERWNKISEEAAKQSKRGRIPTVEEIADFNDLKNVFNNYDLVLIPYEKEDSLSVKKVLKEYPRIRSAAIVIGPEGGFEKEEINYAENWGAKSVTLGPRILRTETAGFVTASILLYELGDLGGK